VGKCLADKHKKKGIFFLLFFLSFSFANGQRYFSTDSLLKVYNSSAPDTCRVQALITLAGVFCSTDSAKSNEYARKGLKEAIALKDEFQIARAHQTIGYNFYLANDHINAVKHYLKSIDSYEKGGDPIMGVANIYNSLGVLYDKQEMFEQAIKCYEKALKLREHKNERWKDDILSNIGSIYGKLEKYGLAEQYLTEALRIENKYGKTTMAAGSMQCLGIIAHRTGRPGLAEKLFDRALFVFDSIGDNTSKSTCLIAIAGFYNESCQHEQASDYAYRARAMIDGLSDPDQLEILFALLIETERAKGNYKTALAYSDSLLLVREKLYSSELSEQTGELLKKYQVEKVDKENALLKEEKILTETMAAKRKTLYIYLLMLVIVSAFTFVLYLRQKKIREEQRSTELEQKVLRTQMNPHFIFNALNAIQKLYLEKNHEQADEYMGDFGQLLRKILDNSGKSFISLHDELATLRLYLNLEKNRMEDKMEYKLSGDENLDMHHIMVPPLILQPVVENAIWHGIAAKGSGKIKIHYAPGKEKLLNFVIEDNGIGMDNSLNRNKANHNSKGLKLTRERLKPNGWVTIEPGSEGGTKVTMSIPYKIE